MKKNKLFFVVFALLFSISKPIFAEGQYQWTTDWVSRYNDLWTNELVGFKGRPGLHMLEVGSYEGRSAIWFLQHILTDPKSDITCVDIFDPKDVGERFDNNMKVAGVTKKVKKIQGMSQHALRKLEVNSYDLIYIDGCHKANCVMSDAVLSWDLLKPGGYMIFDDYAYNVSWEPSERPLTSIDAFLLVFGKYIEVQHKDDAQIILRKKDNHSGHDQY